MLLSYPPAGTAILSLPWTASPAYALARDQMTEALMDFERRYAHELGYNLGPDGEWIARKPLSDEARAR